MSQENDTTKTKICQHLTEAERKIIERQLELGTPKKQIARLLKRNISTIRREIKRGSVIQRKTKQYISKRAEDPGYTEEMRYFADVGQRQYNRNRLRCGRKCRLLICHDFVKYAEQKIRREKWSPDAIVGEAKRLHIFENIPSTVTLYHWIDSRFLDVRNIDLLQKCLRKPRKSRSTEHKKILGTSIEMRPEEVNVRETFGHWEGDSVVGKEGKSSVLTFVERLTGYAIVLKTDGKNAEATYQALCALKERLGDSFNKIFLSITFDNGSEFAASDAFRSLGLDIYYAHPYSAWERGQNENFNGLLRRFIPKGADLSFLSQEDLDRFVRFLNTLPRKKRCYFSADILFSQHLSAIISSVPTVS